MVYEKLEKLLKEYIELNKAIREEITFVDISEIKPIFIKLTSNELPILSKYGFSEIKITGKEIVNIVITLDNKIEIKIPLIISPFSGIGDIYLNFVRPIIKYGNVLLDILKHVIEYCKENSGLKGTSISITDIRTLELIYKLILVTYKVWKDEYHR